MQLGKVYGTEGRAFLDAFGQMILLDGRHLELMFWVDEPQRRLAPKSRTTFEAFRRALDRQLPEAGVIRRVPRNQGKKTFLRDEFKLWNKLGLLEKASGRTYFHRGVGLIFNWRAVVSILRAGEV